MDSFLPTLCVGKADYSLRVGVSPMCAFVICGAVGVERVLCASATVVAGRAYVVRVCDCSCGTCVCCARHRHFERGTCEARGSIKPGAQAPGT